MTASGALMKKIARHETWSMKKPPSSGPATMVIDVNADHVPIALPRSLSGNVALMMARLPGTMSAAPMPCKLRNPMRAAIFGASPHATEPAVNTATPIAKMRLRPNRSPKAPPVSMSDATKSVYASTTHCTSEMVAPIVACSAGSAMFTTVPSMNAMLEPRMVAARTRRRCSGGLATRHGTEVAVCGGSALDEAHETLNESPDLLARLRIGERAVRIHQGVCPGNHQPPLRIEPCPERLQHRQPAVLAEDGPEAAGRGAHERDGPAAEDACNVGVGAREPVDRVLEDAGNRVVVFGRDEEKAVGGRDRFLQRRDHRGNPFRRLDVAVVERNAADRVNGDLASRGHEPGRRVEHRRVERRRPQAPRQPDDPGHGFLPIAGLYDEMR